MLATNPNTHLPIVYNKGGCPAVRWVADSGLHHASTRRQDTSAGAVDERDTWLHYMIPVQKFWLLLTLRGFSDDC